MVPKTTLRLLSDEEVEKLASFCLDDTYDLYDARFGSAGSINFDCSICNLQKDKCLGHNGYISLNCKIFHPLAYTRICEIINSTCLNCKIKTENGKFCIKCNRAIQNDYHINEDSSHYLVMKSSKNYINFTNSAILYPECVENILPKGYVISKIIVPPISIRTPFDIEYATEIQKLYKYLIKIITSNNEYKCFDKYRRKSEDERHKMHQRYAQKVYKLYEMIVGSKKNEGIIGMTGTKNGIFRLIMQGKRLENCARTVITPDPYLELDQVAIPKKIADNIKILEQIDTTNIKEMKELAKNGLLWWQETGDIKGETRHIVDGMSFFRPLQDDDLVLFNRQPSLSRTSMLCFRVLKKKDLSNTFGMNPQVVVPFNADFVGDEMNIFFGVAKKETKNELKELCHLSKNFVVDGKVSVKPVQDLITGCYLMSKEDAIVKRSVYDMCKILYNNDKVVEEKVNISYNVELPLRKISTHYTTHSLLKLFIPDYDGRVIKKENLIKYIENNHNPLKMIQVLQQVVLIWLSSKGLTVSLEDLKVDRSKLDKSDKEKYQKTCLKLVEKELKNTQIMAMIDSGAKGQIVHLKHMAAALGQQIIGGKPRV